MRPDKAERARRQGLAAERRAQEEQDRLDQEKHEQELAAVEEAKWDTQRAAADEARAADEYAARAVEALDELAKLVAQHEEKGEEIPVDYVRDILVTARHPEYAPEPTDRWEA